MRLKKLKEDGPESFRASAKNFRVHFRIFLFGVFICLASAIALKFVAGEPLFEGSSTKSIENLEFSNSDDDLESRKYPAWMDQVVNPPPGVRPANVYSFSCELVLQKPTAFSTTCADFGIAIFDVKWKKWSAEGAKGKGVYSVNDCNPSCAEGTRHEVPVYLWLLDVTTDGKNYFLNTLRIVPTDVYEGKVNEIRSNYLNLNGNVVVEGKTFTGAEWDVSRDWKDFPMLRSDLPK